MSLIILNVDEVRRTLSASGGAFVTHDKEVDIVRFAINSGFADIVLDGQVALRVMYQRPGESQVRAQTLTYHDTDGLHNYYDWQLLSADLAKKGTLTVALCILRTDSEVEEWHTTPCQIRVLDTIHTDDSDEADETITPTVAERVAVLESMIQRVASGAPIVVSSTSDMTDTEQIYVLSTDGEWYYYDGTAWVSGGTYGAVATDTTLTQSGIPADAKKTGDEITKIKADLKTFVPMPIADRDILIEHGRILSNTGELNTSVDISSSYTPYIDVSGLTSIIYTRIISINSSTASRSGMAFYDENKTYISGIAALYSSNSGNYLNRVDVPATAKYARFTSWDPETQSQYMTYPFVVYDAVQFDASMETQVEKNTADIADEKDKIDGILGKNLYADGTFTYGVIKASDGTTGSSSSGFYTDYIDVSAYTALKYTRVLLTSSSTTWGMAFYDTNKDFISGQRPVFNSPSFGYQIAKINVPATAKYARFTWLVSLTKNNFAVYNAADWDASIRGQIKKLQEYHPNYSGKKLSILGDSISTFAATSEKVNGVAAEGCTTNYPGNYVKYSDSDVTNVSLTWWGRVLDHFGMVLGINESWAGSTIGYNSAQTNSGKYTSDNCLCSATRIGHLGENGTPDLIIVFGGTNDINHHLVGTGSTIRYAVGELDSTHNPYDFDNFPMVTDTYYGSITTMLLRIQYSYPNATILMLLPYFCTYTHTSSGDRATPYDQNTWSNVAIDVCKYLGVEYLDLRTIINLYDVSSLLFDGLHPKANGMDAIAKAVIHKLDSML